MRLPCGLIRHHGIITKARHVRVYLRRQLWRVHIHRTESNIPNCIFHYLEQCQPNNYLPMQMWRGFSCYSINGIGNLPTYLPTYLRFSGPTWRLGSRKVHIAPQLPPPSLQHLQALLIPCYGIIISLSRGSRPGGLGSLRTNDDKIRMAPGSRE